MSLALSNIQSAKLCWQWFKYSVNHSRQQLNPGSPENPEKHGSISNPLFLIFFNCMYVLIWGEGTTIILWRSKNNLQESILSFHYMGPGTKFRSSPLTAKAFTHWPTLPVFSPCLWVVKISFPWTTFLFDNTEVFFPKRILLTNIPVIGSYQLNLKKKRWEEKKTCYKS